MAPSSFNPEANTIECVWHTGAEVRRYGRYRGFDGYETSGPYDLTLSMEPKAVRLERLNDHAPFLDNHADYSLSAVIGKVVPGSARIVDGKGLATVALSSAPCDADTVQKLRDGIIANVSVGANIHALTRIDTPDEKRARPLFRADDWEPVEISAVPIGADPGSHTLSHQAQEPDTMSTVNAPAELSPDLKAAERRAERERLGGIRTAFSILAKCTDEGDRAENERLLASCLDSDVSLADARAKFFDRRVEIDAKLSISPVQKTQVNAGRIELGTEECQKRGAAMEAVILARSNLGAMPSDSDNPYAREYRHASLSQMAALACRDAGIDVVGMSNDQVANIAMTQLRTERGAVDFVRLSGGGAMSTSDFPYLLANTARKSLRKGYDLVTKTYQRWAYLGEPLTDYKSRSEILLGDVSALSELPEGATPKLGNMAESNVSMNLTDYAGGFAITRKAIVNDDLRGLTLIPRKFGVAAAQKENALAYAALTGISWDSSNTGATHAAPSATTVSELRTLMRRQTSLAASGGTGRPLNIIMRKIIVPPEHETAARALTVAQYYPQGTSDVIDDEFRALEVIVDGELTNANKWYASADPMMFETIQYAYLAGENGVVIDSNPEWQSGNLVIQARLAFAVKVIDARGLAYNPGV